MSTLSGHLIECAGSGRLHTAGLTSRVPSARDDRADQAWLDAYVQPGAPTTGGDRVLRQPDDSGPGRPTRALISGDTVIATASAATARSERQPSSTGRPLQRRSRERARALRHPARAARALAGPLGRAARRDRRAQPGAGAADADRRRRGGARVRSAVPAADAARASRGCSRTSGATGSWPCCWCGSAGTRPGCSAGGGWWTPRSTTASSRAATRRAARASGGSSAGARSRRGWRSSRPPTPRRACCCRTRRTSTRSSSAATVRRCAR